MRIFMIVAVSATRHIAQAWSSRACFSHGKLGRASSISSSNSLLSTTRRYSSLISLPDALDEADTAQFIDGSWYHKGGRSGREEFEQGPRIAGSIHFDLSDMCDTESSIPSMLPPPSLLQAYLQDHHSIDTQNKHLIVYGKEGASFTPRVWFTLQRLYPRVSLMQASFEEWMAAGGPVDTEPVQVVRAADLHVSTRHGDDQKHKDDTIDLDGHETSCGESRL